MNPRLLHASICLALAAFTSICLGRVLDNDFVNIDDPHYVTANAVVQTGLNEASLRWAWTTTHAGFWMPLTWMSLELDATLYWPRSVADADQAASMAACGFHLTNLLLHLVNTLLVYRLMWKLTGSLGCSALIAALFGVHPLRVESVAWITERKDVLSCCFGLLALLAYLHYRDKPGVWRMLVVCLLFEMSLLAKPVLVTLPVIMLLLDWWRVPCFGTPKHGFTCLLEKLPLFGLSLLCTWITIQAQRSTGATSMVEVALPWRLANAAVSYESYLAKTFWPVGLAVFYPHPRESLTGPHIGVACLVLLGVTVFVLAARKRVPAMLVGWLWFIIGLTPNIGLIQAGAQGMADRFTYFPLLGLFLAVVAGADYLARRWRISIIPRIAAAIVVVAGLGAMAWVQVGLWKNCQSLYEHALSVTVDNADIHRYLGIYFLQQGDFQRADQHLADALAVSKRLDANVRFDLYLYYGAVLHWKKDWPRAVENLEKAVELAPQNVLGHYLLAESLWNLGKALNAQGQPALARQTIRRAMAMTADPKMRAAMEASLRGLD